MKKDEKGQETTPPKEAPFKHEVQISRNRMRFELAKSAISGLAYHQLNKPVAHAVAAVSLADLVLAELDKPAPPAPVADPAGAKP